MRNTLRVPFSLPASGLLEVHLPIRMSGSVLVDHRSNQVVHVRTFYRDRDATPEARMGQVQQVSYDS